MRQWASVLLALGRAIAWASLTHGGFAVLTFGLCVAGLGLLMLVGLSALPLPQPGRPKKVPLTSPTTPQILVGFAAVGDPISPLASDRMHLARPP
jgi:hypothetical protein